MKRALTDTRNADTVTVYVCDLINTAPPEAFYQDRVTVIQPHINTKERSRGMTSHKRVTHVGKTCVCDKFNCMS